MAIIANFIGIDKYLDPNIRDLTGARKDATALWALFSDTITGISANLILDEKANTETVHLVLCNILANATTEDTIIISFSGHGSHNHRLATYDCERERLDETTISMKEIAIEFKKSKAKRILFILDCCFSGGAPARVLEDSPIPRDITNPFNDFIGEGRVLLAASNFDEVAYETPGSGYGLLSNALIKILQSGEKQYVDMLSAMSEIMDSVRAEAQRIGVTQTPVLITGVTGGFILPRLKVGDNYFEKFPEARGVKISSNINDLRIFGLPNEIIKLWSSIFNDGLNDLQLTAVNENRIFEGESLLVVAPTSSGKTFIGELATVHAVLQGKKAVFLFPYRALTNEKYEQFSAHYSEKGGMRVIRCSGDYVDQTGPFVAGKYDIALLTYEMFLNLAVSNPWVLNQIGLVVIDEAQFIADPNRGIVVELLLTYLLNARNKGITPQIVALSAVIGGINYFDEWLQCQKLITTNRPVSLIEGVLDRNGTYQFLNADREEKTSQLLPIGVIRQRRNKPSSQDVIVPLVKKLIHDNKNEKIIVFRNQRGTAEGVANYLAQDLGLPAALEAIEMLPNHDLSTTSSRLKTCMEGGTAFHNTNLSREEKTVVEQMFRDPDSKVRILGATTTVAAGVNTPASTVIIPEHKFIGNNGRDYTVAEYKNMAGRAGRLGFHEEGKAIIIAETSFEREQLFNKYVKGDLGNIASSFDPNHIETWIIRLLAQIDRIPKEDISHLLANTYGGFLAVKMNPKWRNEMDINLTKLLNRMISLELVEQEREFIQLTLLGRACGKSALSFESSMRLVEFLKGITPFDLSAERLMVLTQALPELDDTYTPVMKRGQKESVRPREARQHFGSDAIRTLQKYSRDEFTYYARCKRAAILWAWIEGLQVEAIEQQFSTTPYQGRIGYGDIIKFADATRFYLRSSYQIADIMFLGEGLNEETIENILKQLETGLPATALNLLDIELPLERGEYLQLLQKGITSPDDFWSLDPESLDGILSFAKIEKYKELKLKKEKKIS